MIPMELKDAITYSLAFLLSCYCACTDWKIRKIQNKLTFPMMGAGLALNTIFWGLPGLRDSFLGFLAGFSLFLLFAAGALKAGDVKLFMALGALLGYRLNLWVIAVSILIGGAAGVCMMLSRRNGRERWKGLWLYLKGVFLYRKLERYQAEGEGAYLCFGICVVVGVLVVIGLRIYQEL